MTEQSAHSANKLSDSVKASWRRFLDIYEPLRPDLYRYCRYLTRSPWDAEDLAQDTLARAFVTLGCLFKGAPPNPKAWLLRVASNLWIDRTRRVRETVVGDIPEVAAQPDPQVDPEAAGILLARLSPQERAAVVLKDAFDFTLEEIADALSTTVGAIKTALHRGRTKLAAPEPQLSSESRTAVPAAISAFCDAFNTRDLDRLTGLLLDNATVEIVGLVTEYGPEATRDPDTGSFHGMLFGDLSSDDPRGGVERELRAGVLADAPRVEIRLCRDEPVALFWYSHADGDAVRAVARFEADGDRLVRVRNYFYTPDVITEVCGELGVPCRINGYRYWYRTQGDR